MVSRSMKFMKLMDLKDLIDQERMGTA